MEDSCYYPLMGAADVQQCLKGRHVAIIGDSVTQGLFFDIMHMWNGYQRGPKGEVMDKRNLCHYNEKNARYEPNRDYPDKMQLPGGC